MSGEVRSSVQYEQEADDFQATVTAVSRLAELRDNDAGTDTDFAQRAVADLASALKEPPGDALEVAADRAHEILELSSGITHVLDETCWSPVEFRDAIGCTHSVDQLASQVDLGKCNDLMRFLRDALRSVSNAPAERQQAVIIAVETFRLARRDYDEAVNFWMNAPADQEDGASAHDKCKEGDPTSALQVVLGHVAARQTRLNVAQIPESVLRVYG